MRWFDPELVIEPLEGFATLPDWLAAGMDGERVQAALGRQVSELTHGRTQVVSCTPERLRAKGEEWLARYRLSVAEPGDEPREVVLVGRLFGPGTPGPAELPRRSDVTFGALGWTGWLEDLRLELAVEAEDPALPALEDILDPDAARDLVQEVVVGAGYRDAVVTACRPHVVRYKPGSRCTVVVEVSYDHANGHRPGPDPVVIKTHQGDKGSTAWAAMTALWQSPLAQQGVVTLAEPLAYRPDRRILVQGPVPEDCTLKELARTAIADGGDDQLDRLRQELRKTGHALAALHTSSATYGETATLVAELAELRDVVGRLSFSVAPLEAAAEPLLSRLEELSEATSADPSVSAHHDFRPAQVLLHSGQVGFIDFDGASMAEPALDLGRFRAKLRDIGISALYADGHIPSAPALREHLSVMGELCEHFLAAYREKADVSTDRVVLWETCDLLTSMLHAWTKVRLARIGPRLTILQRHLEQHAVEAHAGG